MKATASAALVLIGVIAIGTLGYMNGYLTIQIPEDPDDPDQDKSQAPVKTEYLTFFISSYNMSTLLSQRYTINYTIQSFGTFTLYKNTTNDEGDSLNVDYLNLPNTCFLNFTSASEIKGRFKRTQLNSTPSSAQPGSEEEEEPLQALIFSDSTQRGWAYLLTDKLTGVNFVITLFILSSNTEVKGMKLDLPFSDPIFQTPAQTFIQLQLFNDNVPVQSSELTADNLSDISQGLFNFEADSSGGTALPAVQTTALPAVQTTFSSCIVTNSVGMVMQIVEV